MDGSPPPQRRPKDLAGYLEAFSRPVFQAGMSWRVIDAKWDGIRDAFAEFEPTLVADYGQDDVEMKPYFKMSQTISRPVDEVFATVIRLDEFPRWSPRNPWAKKLTPGDIGGGTRFQMGIKGFGKVTNELREFESNKRVMVAPLSSMLEGGHRWIFTGLGNGMTRIDHELEMRPKGLYKLMGPMLRSSGVKTVKETAAALQRYLEREA